MHLTGQSLPTDRAVRQLVRVCLGGAGVVMTQLEDLGGPEVWRFGLASALPSLSGSSIPDFAHSSDRVRHATSLGGRMHIWISQWRQPSAVGEDTFGDDRQLISDNEALPRLREKHRRVGEAIR